MEMVMMDEIIQSIQILAMVPQELDEMVVSEMSVTRYPNMLYDENMKNNFSLFSPFVLMKRNILFKS
jgi:hypothetical protein